jgi:hypothetical protein
MVSRVGNRRMVTGQIVRERERESCVEEDREILEERETSKC